MSKGGLKNNVLLSELSSFCQKHPRTEKILITPDYQAGHQILESLTRGGTSWINFHVITMLSLAIEFAEDAIASKNLQTLPQSGIHVVVDSIFNALSDSGKLKYFEKHPINKGIVEALARTVCELRLHGISSDTIKKGSLLSPSKENDIRLLLSSYEKIMEERHFADKAELIALALKETKKVTKKGEKIYFIPSSYYMSGIERQLLEKICGDDLVVLKEDPAYGLDIPSDSLCKENPEKSPDVESNIERLKWLFASRKAPPVIKDGTIDILSALGYRNEIREILRRIVAGKIAVNDVEVIYTNQESYAELIYSLCEKLQMPVTFSEGLPAYITGAGRALMGFLLWVKEDFGEINLRRTIDSGGLKWDSKSDETAGSSSLAYLLRTSGIGWGRDRYSLILSKKIQECKKTACELREEGDESAALYQEDKVKNLAALKGLCEGLLDLIPPMDRDGKIDFNKLCLGCVKFLEKHIKISNVNDAIFMPGVKEQFEMLATLIESKMIFEEAISKLINIVSGMRIMAAGPKPGHLYVSSAKNGGRSGRGNTFIVGLDEGKFPEKISQDPILLDDERKNISDVLEVSDERMAKNIYNMAQLVSGLRGKLTVSFSAFDIKEGRKSFPSSFVLQIFRIKEGDPKADYNTLFNALGDPVGFDGKIDLDEIDWWIKSLTEKGVLKDGTEAVTRYYEGVKDGLTAKEKRSSDVFTEYDGKVTDAESALDPRLNKKMIMSATRLEAAARCPFAYFIENILGVRKPEETEKEIFVWLDALERGALFHEVFQKFVDATKEKKGDDPKKDRELILSILDDIVKQYKEDIPPPSETIFQNEYIQLKRDVDVFLKITGELKTKPVECEAVFGDDAKNAVSVPLGSGKSILLRGKIDRIDKVGSSEYHVWDYKTGSSYSYEEKGYVAGGEQVQHSLYAVAAEEILKKSGKDKNTKVTKSGYILPTEKGTREGKGGIFERQTDKKEVWQNAVNKVLDLVGKGNFIATTKDACKFCDYVEVCGGEDARNRMKIKLDNPANKEIQVWVDLKDME